MQSQRHSDPFAAFNRESGRQNTEISKQGCQRKSRIINNTRRVKAGGRQETRNSKQARVKNRHAINVV